MVEVVVVPDIYRITLSIAEVLRISYKNDKKLKNLNGK